MLVSVRLSVITTLICLRVRARVRARVRVRVTTSAKSGFGVCIVFAVIEE